MGVHPPRCWVDNDPVEATIRVAHSVLHQLAVFPAHHSLPAADARFNLQAML
jgi:hypothetical protein